MQCHCPSVLQLEPSSSSRVINVLGEDDARIREEKRRIASAIVGNWRNAGRILAESSV